MQKNIAERLLKKRSELFIYTMGMGCICQITSRNLSVDSKEAGININ